VLLKQIAVAHLVGVAVFGPGCKKVSGTGLLEEEVSMDVVILLVVSLLHFLQELWQELNVVP
jgi:hypothetical protein